MPRPVEQLPDSVRRFAPWTWSLRTLAFPLLIVSWVAAFCVGGVTFTIAENWPSSHPAVQVTLGLIYLASTLWIAIAPFIALVLAMFFVQEYFRSERLGSPWTTDAALPEKPDYNPLRSIATQIGPSISDSHGAGGTCSFCRKPRREVGPLVKGAGVHGMGGVFICRQCTMLSVAIFEEENAGVETV